MQDLRMLLLEYTNLLNQAHPDAKCSGAHSIKLYMFNLDLQASAQLRAVTTSTAQYFICIFGHYDVSQQGNRPMQAALVRMRFLEYTNSLHHVHPNAQFSSIHALKLYKFDLGLQVLAPLRDITTSAALYSTFFIGQDDISHFVAPSNESRSLVLHLPSYRGKRQTGISLYCISVTELLPRGLLFKPKQTDTVV